jgi:hypothetical protein
MLLHVPWPSTKASPCASRVKQTTALDFFYFLHLTLGVFYQNSTELMPRVTHASNTTHTQPMKDLATPVQAAQREIFMDVLRGFAILGIFIANCAEIIRFLKE